MCVYDKDFYIGKPDGHVQIRHTQPRERFVTKANQHYYENVPHLPFIFEHSCGFYLFFMLCMLCVCLYVCVLSFLFIIIIFVGCFGRIASGSFREMYVKSAIQRKMFLEQYEIVIHITHLMFFDYKYDFN